MQNQMPFPEPPRAITTKDLMYLKDILSWELLAFKKFHSLAGQAQDMEIKQALEKVGQMHQSHYQKVLTHLQVNNNAGLGNMPASQQMQ